MCIRDSFGAVPGVLLGVTGGYIIGFIFTAAIVGCAVSHFGKKIPVYIISMVLGVAAVSYTHLDVYKRQAVGRPQL